MFIAESYIPGDRIIFKIAVTVLVLFNDAVNCDDDVYLSIIWEYMSREVTLTGEHQRIRRKPGIIVTFSATIGLARDRTWVFAVRGRRVPLFDHPTSVRQHISQHDIGGSVWARSMIKDPRLCDCRNGGPGDGYQLLGRRPRGIQFAVRSGRTAHGHQQRRSRVLQGAAEPSGCCIQTAGPVRVAVPGPG